MDDRIVILICVIAIVAVIGFGSLTDCMGR